MLIGWGTIAYGFVAGACAIIAGVFFLSGGRRNRLDPLMLSFGLFALVAAMNTIVTVRLHLAPNVEEYRQLFKLFGVVSLAGVVSVVILAAVWTRSVPKWSLVLFAAGTVVIGVLQVSLPNGLLAGDIESLRDVTLFGEQFVVHVGSTAPFRWMLDVYFFGTGAVVIVALVRGFRRGLRDDAMLVLLSVITSFVVGVWDGFVDSGQADTTYLTPFGLSVVVIAGAVHLANRSVWADVRLQEQATRLEETVIDRTAALIESSRRLEEQLQRQRRSVRNLAALANEFEASNALVEPTQRDVEASLHGLLHQIGEMVPAAAVELQVDDTRFDTVLAPLMTWHAAEPPTDGGLIDVSEPIRIGTRQIGVLTARSVRPEVAGLEEPHYLELSAEHLSGVFHRLELIGRMADSAVEEERQRIAMELHDSVTQRLYSVSFLADAAVHQAEEDPEQVADTVRRIREFLLASLAELRSLMFELRPQAFDNEDLDSLVRQLVVNAALTSDLDIRSEATRVPPLPPHIKVGLYRIAQEALSNACRHSNADQVCVRLDYDDGVTRLAVSDDGVGFDTDATADGRGLNNIRARARRIGADIDVSSVPAAGTTIETRWTQSTAPTPVRTAFGR